MQDFRVVIVLEPGEMSPDYERAETILTAQTPERAYKIAEHLRDCELEYPELLSWQSGTGPAGIFITPLDFGPRFNERDFPELFPAE